MDFINFWKELTSHKNILMGVHVSPDGDCVGSSLALRRVLKSLGKKADIYSFDPIPDNCKFLSDTDFIIVKTLPNKKYDLFLLLDCNTLDRTKLSDDEIKTLPKTKMVIDHHVAAPSDWYMSLINQKAPATADIIYNLLKANNIEIDKDTAEMLLTGIICDTGCYKHSNTTAETFSNTAQLMEKGANVSYIAKEYFDSRSLKSLMLMGYVLNNIKVYDDDKIIIGYVDYNFIIDNEITDLESESINGQLSCLKDHVFSVFMRETYPNVIRCSLRSPDKVNCNEIANAFNGGGHVNASGCTLKMPLDEAINKMLEEVRKHING